MFLRHTPLVKQKEEQLDKVRENLLENLKNIKIVNNFVLADLKSKNVRTEGEIKALPAKTLELVELKRHVEGKQNLYNFLLEKREETAISRAATIPNSKIIDKAFPDTTPIKPQPRTLQLFAILIGLAIPALFIFIAELLNDKVTTRLDIEKVTQHQSWVK